MTYKTKSLFTEEKVLNMS